MTGIVSRLFPTFVTFFSCFYPCSIFFMLSNATLPRNRQLSSHNTSEFFSCWQSILSNATLHVIKQYAVSFCSLTHRCSHKLHWSHTENVFMRTQYVATCYELLTCPMQHKYDLRRIHFSRVALLGEQGIAIQMFFRRHSYAPFVSIAVMQRSGTAYPVVSYLSLSNCTYRITFSCFHIFGMKSTWQVWLTIETWCAMMFSLWASQSQTCRHESLPIATWPQGLVSWRTSQSCSLNFDKLGCWIPRFFLLQRAHFAFLLQPIQPDSVSLA